MFKSSLAAFAAVTLFSAGFALAQDKATIDPSKAGPTESMTKQVPAMSPDGSAPTAAGTAADAKTMKVNCSAVGIDEANASIKAMTDTAKQKMAMDHMVMAKKSMDAKDTAGCEMHMKEAMGGMSAPATKTN